MKTKRRGVTLPLPLIKLVVQCDDTPLNRVDLFKAFAGIKNTKFEGDYTIVKLEFTTIMDVAT